VLGDVGLGVRRLDADLTLYSTPPRVVYISLADGTKTAADVVEEVHEEDQNDTQFFRQVSLGRIQGVELALKIPSDIAAPIQKWGIEDPGRMVGWMRGVISRFQSLNPGFEVGVITTIEARGPQRILHATVDGSTTTVVGMLPTASKEQVEETTRKVLERWAS